jgi:hypothetical protein
MGNKHSYDLIKGPVTDSTVMVHDAIIKEIVKVDNGKYKIFIFPKIYDSELNGDPYLKTNNPNFDVIFNFLQVNRPYSFDIDKIGKNFCVRNATIPDIHKITKCIVGVEDINDKYNFLKPLFQLLFNGSNIMCIIGTIEQIDAIKFGCVYEISYKKNNCERMYSLVSLSEKNEI